MKQAMQRLYARSYPSRRDFLRRRGYKPSVGLTVLTQIPHWTAEDGQTFTEVEAWLREKRKTEDV